MRCKYCQSANVIKYGSQSGRQMYYCKDCKRKFKDDKSLLGGRVPAEYISSALSMYYDGMSINDICRHLKQEKDYKPSKSVVFKWVNKFTDKAVDYYSTHQPKVGDTWACDETVLHLDNQDIWFWDIIDEKTRFLLASKISFTRNISDAKTLFRLAKSRADKSPKVIITDKLWAYPDAVNDVFQGTVLHVQSKPFTSIDSTNYIERWHSTLKERLKVMRTLKDPSTTLQFTDGFLAYYNFIRPHESLNDRTPAEEANINYDVKSWTDVIRLGEPSQAVSTKTTEHKTPPELATARLVITGKPYKAGRKRKHRIKIKETMPALTSIRIFKKT